MSDNKSKTGSPDRDRINLSEDYEVQYWTKELGISEKELRDVIQAVGNTSKAVREHLSK
ncbi:DUF3606 domain-containing protein [Solilutibacter tolerans]|uniref:DUF3606 domain-containing protein n=1 Tax=Solilutibacter tolerans TaxID=1604334 RepID=A0A1N6S404_9GAMM|nr:DUF3606 domain-containing protein [Lysobacter tolerans]SIQ35878.1 Protein of unknown function [Lysobacter tolerans]